ncbi:MAG: queuosine precursor transporter [Tannerella sp.]|nr:queuosine precursor transporter [Tannerella sp.]
MKKTVSVPFMITGILFVVCLIVSNFLETKIISLGPVTSTAGLLVFPVSYILNDCISEVWGFRKARLIIWCGFAMNFIVVGFVQLSIMLPSAPFWEGGDSFNYIFGLTPRIVVASLCAFLVGSFINAYVMSRMKLSSHGRDFSLRAVVSTLAGESADSLIFFPIAFGGIIPTEELLLMVGTQAALKSLYEIIILPITIQVVRYVKKIDGSDAYDNNVSFNPFKIKDI